MRLCAANAAFEPPIERGTAFVGEAGLNHNLFDTALGIFFLALLIASILAVVLFLLRAAKAHQRNNKFISELFGRSLVVLFYGGLMTATCLPLKAADTHGFAESADTNQNHTGDDGFVPFKAGAPTDLGGENYVYAAYSIIFVGLAVYCFSLFRRQRTLTEELTSLKRKFKLKSSSSA